METGRENESRLQSLVESLRSQVTDLESRAGAFESVAGRSEFTVAALQKENKAAQERIVDLEARQRYIVIVILIIKLSKYKNIKKCFSWGIDLICSANVN